MLEYSRFFVMCLVAGIVSAVFGAFFAAYQHPYSIYLAIAGNLLGWVHAVACLDEIYSYPRLPLIHKVLWTVFLFGAPLLTGTIYYFARKKYVVEENDE
jgi:hypothetical protein